MGTRRMGGIEFKIQRMEKRAKKEEGRAGHVSAKEIGAGFGVEGQGERLSHRSL